MAGLGQDLRFVIRSLGKRRGFTAVAVGILAVGIGGATTVYTVVNGVLIRPLPYEASERIGILWHDLGNGAQSLPALNPLDLYDYREWSRAFEDFTLATGDEEIFGGPDAPQLVDVAEVEAGFFEFFGVEPIHGRLITADDDQPGSARIALLSHRLWVSHFGSDPTVVGRTIDVGGDVHQLIGVLPERFRLHLPAEAFRLRDAEIFTAVRIDRSDQPPRNYTGYTGFARLRPGATFAQGQAELDRMEARLKELHSEHAAANLQARVVPLHADVVKGGRSTLLLLFAAVGLMLLVACANVANLLLVRGRSRQMELTVRRALGAASHRIFRLVLLESAVLAALGAGVGLMVAAVSMDAVRNLGAASLPRLGDVRIDGSVILFASGVAALAVLAAGLVPALRAAGGRSSLLVDGGRTGRSRADARFGDALVLAEVGITVVLLVGAGLMIRSFNALQEANPGFQTEGLLTFRITLPDAAFPDDSSEIRFYNALQERIGGLPGVESVSAVSQLPLTGSGPLRPYAYDDETAVNWESVTADAREVSPGFFRTIGATLLAGRDFTRADAELDHREVIIVDDELAQRAFPDGDAVGRSLQVRSNDAPESERYAEVIGVVSHLHLHDLRRRYLTQIYEPMDSDDEYSVVVRTSLEPEPLAPLVRREVAALGPGIVLENVRSMASLTADAMAPMRMTLILTSLFGGIALAMAAVGLYSVLSFVVRQRSREIGIRLVLGQGPRAVGKMILVRGMRLTIVAMLGGVALSVVLGRLASSLLYEVHPADPVTYVGAVGVLAVAAVAACWIPARRAAVIDPAEMLRDE